MKFSVIIPAYKPFFLKECIDSILGQTYSNLEIIIVNDASPYNIDSIVQNYQDSRIHYYKNENNYGAEKMVDNWNRCMNYTTGDYIINMGDDDLLCKDCLSNYYELIKKYPEFDIYHTRTKIINENSDVIGIQSSRPETESVYSMIWHRWNGRIQMIGDWCFRASKLKEIGGFYYLPCAWGSDDISAFQVAEEHGCANMQAYGFMYRQNSHTISQNVKHIDKKITAWLQIDKWYSNFFEKTPNNEDDYLYYKLLKKGLPAYIYGRKTFEIRMGLNGSPSSLFKWLKLSNHIGIGKLHIIHTFLNVIFNKIFKFIS